MAPPADLPTRLRSESPYRHVLPRAGAMRVPGVVYASHALLPAAVDDRSLEQVANVATLPGIVEASYAMPDVHWGYGFPIGGVAATDVEAAGVVSPGGVGFDISCGVRLLVSDTTHGALAPDLSDLLDELARTTPRGVGPGGVWRLEGRHDLERILEGGAAFAVAEGHGTPADLERCEDGGVLAGADAASVSERAMERGLRQVGSLGSGNHFLELQVVDEVIDRATAAAFALEPGRVVVMIHSGSRGLGHQICSDHVAAMLPVMARYGIEVPDPQLACAPVDSLEGQAYLGAMAAAANYGRANRQLLTQAVRQAFARTTSARLDLLYDVSHNLAKIETHVVDGRPRRLCVHRKGATRALPPGHPDLPTSLQTTGQPVLLPGSMGTASYVLAGVDPGGAFHSAAHGAGRVMSRHAALRRIGASQLRGDLEARGVAVRAASRRGLVEEAPFAYKDVDEVARVCEAAGLARRVARLRPVGVIKG